MNFFRSILSDDPDPPKQGNPRDSDPNSPVKSPRNGRESNDAAGAWGFQGLIKTLAIESVIETYRKDLKEFGSGLKKETDLLRESASRAVKDLPASLEASASVAQGALETLKLKAEILSKESLGHTSDGESVTLGTNLSVNSARYSWFEAQIGAIQNDLATFCEDPEDLEEYQKWKAVFELKNYKDEADGLIWKNGNLEGVYMKLVPASVEPETFWCRYFYRVEKIKQQEMVRANLMKRTIPVDDEEELTWDFDDEEEEEEARNGIAGGLNVKKGDATDIKSNPVEKKEVSTIESQDEKEQENVDKRNAAGSMKEIESEVKRDETVESKQTLESGDERVIVDENVDSSKKNDFSVFSGDQTMVVKEDEEEDLGWDEIDDIGSDDEKKVSAAAESGSPSRTELRKRMSAEEEDDEDLSWDIEDDDEPVKKP